MQDFMVSHEVVLLTLGLGWRNCH